MSTSVPTDVVERGKFVRQFQAIARSLWISQAIYVAAELGIADALADGPQGAEQVAKAVGADPGAVKRLMRALVTLDLLAQTEDGAFELAPLGTLLRADQPDSLRSSVLLGGPRYRQHWGELVNCVRTGQTAVKILDDIDDPFQAFAERPNDLAIFNRSMAEACRQVAGPIVAAIDFSGVSTVVDVGGGHGALVERILGENPEITGVVFDLQWCADGAAEAFAKAGLDDRAAFVAGDFLHDALPSGADLYLLKSVIHDWNDDGSRSILRSCRAACAPSSRVLVVEVPVPRDLESSPEHQRMVSADLNMLVSTGGQERTEAEYRDLLADASFEVTGIVPTSSGFAVIEARPV